MEVWNNCCPSIKILDSTFDGRTRQHNGSVLQVLIVYSVFQSYIVSKIKCLICVQFAYNYLIPLNLAAWPHK